MLPLELQSDQGKQSSEEPVRDQVNWRSLPIYRCLSSNDAFDVDLLLQMARPGQIKGQLEEAETA